MLLCQITGDCELGELSPITYNVDACRYNGEFARIIMHEHSSVSNVIIPVSNRRIPIRISGRGHTSQIRYSLGMTKPNFTAKCPTCNRPFAADVAAAHMPFCSDRCKLADLHRWMSEEIGVPTGCSEPEDDPEPEPPTATRQWNFD